ncbi:peroxisomal ATPase PEX1-like [Brevipalpus obovatus]|uniref:peroxisomal ATPase PEX1-like n=1 Tax=Brevipalpus obovatus TaxID=246614 RepID=UPI003D9E9B25
MMDGIYSLVVKLIDSNECFLSISKKYFDRFPKTDGSCVLKINLNGRNCYFSAHRHDDKEADVIHFPRILAENFDLIDQQGIMVRFINDIVPECTRCILEMTDNPSSFDLVSMQDDLITRIRVIHSDMIFPYVIGNQTVLQFKVKKIQPDAEVARLVKNTHVEIHESSTNSGDNPQQARGNSKIADIISSFFPSLLQQTPETNPSTHSNDRVDCVDGMRIRPCSLSPFTQRKVFNLIPAPENIHSSKTFNTIWINPNDLDSNDASNIVVGLLVKLLSPSEKMKMEHKRPDLHPSKPIDSIGAKEDNLFSNTYVTILTDTSCPVGGILVSDNVRLLMDLPWNSKLCLRTVDSQENLGRPNQSVFLCPIEMHSHLSIETIRNFFNDYVTKNGHLTICRGSTIEIAREHFFIATDPTRPWIFITMQTLKKLDFRINNKPHHRMNTSWGKRLPLTKLPTFSVDSSTEVDDHLSSQHGDESFVPWMENTLQRVENFLYAELNESQIDHSCLSSTRKSLLICGSKGSGKTVMLKRILQEVGNRLSTPLFVRTVPCSIWKSMPSIKKQWSLILADCVFFQPSVLIFEDLDLMSPNITRHEEVPSVESIASLRIANMFISYVKLFDDYTSKFGSRVAFISTCQNQASLNPVLVPLRGRRAFSDIIKLSPPDSYQREKILGHLLVQQNLQDYLSDRNWLKEIIRQTEGYLVSDLINLVDSAIHHAISQNRSGMLIKDDFAHSFESFRPTSMKGSKKGIGPVKLLSDIGGLHEVKEVLKHTLLEPIKYPNLFAKCPIRPPRNVLIYGPPGTGKSVLAEALANESKVDLLKVRGPELLSKYIGKSEESIRELFERARQMKPCIIFFDEFESLAPRRGQDTTGVTDRVVNQLLAQMDGVETIDQGVYAIASTSRPDLLDPALLRPGRFDKALKCNFPNACERMEIWKILGRTVNLDPNLDEELIKDITENFTGADIRALLINCQYAAIDDFEASCTDSRPTAEEKASIIIKESHVLSARERTKPSLDSEKRKEYDYIYGRFSGKIPTTLPSQQTATLK